MTRILVLEPDRYSDDARAILRRCGDVIDGPMTREELLSSIADVDVLVVRLGHRIDAEVLDAAKRLRAIVSATTGLDHIAVDDARQRDVAVLSLRGQTEFLRTVPATAEHTWALLLALVRRIPAAFASVRGGEWDRDRFRGSDLAGKTIGIVGYGRVGTRVGAYARAFEMRVRAYDVRPVDGVELAPTLDDLLRDADVVSLHAPLDDSTHKLIGRAQLALLGPGAVLINTSRGALVDEDALVDALERGTLAGAALDVVDGEPNPPGGTLLGYARAHDNLLITPHIGGATAESMAKTEIFMARQLERSLAGEDA